MTKKQIEFVLFDNDGLLIDSERVYTDVTNQILEPYGKVMTWDIKKGCMGLPQEAAAAHLLSFFPDIDLTPEDYLVQRNALQDTQWGTVKLLPGAEKFIRHLKAHKIPIAVATSSSRRNFQMKSEHLQHVYGPDGFGADFILCGDDLVENKSRKIDGKPNPDIFLSAAREKLGLAVGTAENGTEEELRIRSKGLVFEDAIPGVQAGKRASMSVVWIPDPNLVEQAYDGELNPDQTITSLELFKPEEWGLPAY